MSSPKPPKPQKVNPYQGMDANPEFAEAARQEGINNANSPEEIARINKRIQENRTAGTYKDDYWYRAASDVGGLRYYDKASYESWAESEGYSSKETSAFSKKQASKYGTDDWYYQSEDFNPDGMQLDQINARAYDYKLQEDTENQNQMLIDQSAAFAKEANKQQKDMMRSMSKATKAQTRAAKKQNKATIKANKQEANRQRADLAARDAQNQAQMEAAAESQRAFMEEMMNQPVYMPKQQAPPSVQKPMPKQNPIMPAPAAPSPMNIAPPPAPELTAANNKMAIVRTPKSTRARQRRATRGTSSLIN